MYCATADKKDVALLSYTLKTKTKLAWKQN